MILGNKYLYISTNELNLEGSISKHLSINLLFVLFMITLEETHIIFSITLFKKLRINLTLFVL
mgnify:FL=1|jgi:hypothetical protein